MGFGMRYALDVESVKDKSVLWTLNGSSLIESNVGGWRLTDLGDGSTKVSYGCEVELKASVPSFVTKFVLSQAFPKMLKTFSKCAQWRAPCECDYAAAHRAPSLRGVRAACARRFLHSHPAPPCFWLLYPSPSPRDGLLSRMPSSA